MHATVRMESSPFTHQHHAPPRPHHLSMSPHHAHSGFDSKLGMVDHFSADMDNPQYERYMYGDDSIAISHSHSGYPHAPEDPRIGALANQLREAEEQLAVAELDLEHAQEDLSVQCEDLHSAQARLTNFVQGARRTTARMHEQERIGRANAEELQRAFAGCSLQNRALAEEMAAMEREIAELEAEFDDDSCDTMSYDEATDGEESSAAAAAGSAAAGGGAFCA